ncbi:MAG: DUF2817 domain-containing protein [Actinobacteria bacterium]|nr:DUF2817 domain-containing protein [Actinomycetota bacterium]
MPNHLARTYQQARSDFLADAARAGGEVISYKHPQTGLEGEELAIDVAQFGGGEASSVLFVVSGTHGVEGYSGSALQRHLISGYLADRSAEQAAALRVVLVHALNPVGFSWVRRVNEDNVDLNRNFIDWGGPLPADAGYDEIADLVVPQEWSADAQEASTAQLLEVVARVGLADFQARISSGQYRHKTGIFYGGAEKTWSHRWLEDHADMLAGSATKVGIVDLHTGLGPWGHGELISHEARSDAGYERGIQWWGEVRSMADGESVSAAVTGDWLGRSQVFLGQREVTAVALEFGTVDVIAVLQSLRADAWLHAYGDPTGPDAPAIRAKVRAAFADDDPLWIETLAVRLDEVIAGSVAGLTN